MRYNTSGTLLNTARRRLWLQGLMDRLWLALVLTSGVLGLAAVLHMFHLPVNISWWGTAALLPLVVAIVLAVLNRPSLEVSARAADRWLNSHDLLTAALYLRSQTPLSSSAAARIVLDQADRLAADPSLRLPRFHKSGHALPTTIAVAVAATSLFFLSLPGPAPSARFSTASPHEPRVRDLAAENDWMSALETGLPGAAPVGESTQAMQEPSKRSFGSSMEPARQASTGAEEDEQGESGSGAHSNALQVAKGAGAGRVASMEPPRQPVPGSETSGDRVALIGVELVDLQRKPAGEAMAIDRAVSVGLLPSTGGTGQPATPEQEVPAARAAKQAHSPSVGPAYRALQARYFEETSRSD